MRNASKTILIVEDDDDIREIMAEFLCMEGYAVRAAINGREAVGLLEQWRPDIALLDVTLPDMSGIEICRILKNSESTKDTDVIFISGRTALHDRLNGFLAGGKRYVCKPFLMEDVLNHLDFIAGSQRGDLERDSPLMEDHTY